MAIRFISSLMYLNPFDYKIKIHFLFCFYTWKKWQKGKNILYIHPSCQLLSKMMETEIYLFIGENVLCYCITVIVAKLMQFTKYTLHFMRFSWIIPRMYHITFVWQIKNKRQWFHFSQICIWSCYNQKSFILWMDTIGKYPSRHSN